MKRSLEDLSSSYTSSSSGTAPTTAYSHKSLKRLRIENEIFSKSIKDIEKMFAPAQSTRSPQAVGSKNPSCDQYLPDTNDHGKYKYDCINLAFLPSQQTQSPQTTSSCTDTTVSENVAVMAKAVPILPSQRSMLQPKSTLNRTPPLFLDFDLTDPDHDLAFPKESLEHDLNLIDQLVLLH